MPLRVFMVASYMLICALIGTKPCKYFQLNSRWFNASRGVFSKVDIDQLVAPHWRLQQVVDDGHYQPDRWPVFVKPEWGQNAAGVMRADNEQQLDEIRSQVDRSRVRYLIQQAAQERREYEVFWIRDPNSEQPAVLTITEAINESDNKPVNSINNPNTEYVEITDQFSAQDLRKIWNLVQQPGAFNIARASLSADTRQQLVDGEFHVIEINLFVPMPINLLDSRYSTLQVARMVLKYMTALARLTRARDKTLPEQAVFTRMMLYNPQSRWMNYLRNRL